MLHVWKLARRVTLRSVFKRNLNHVHLVMASLAKPKSGWLRLLYFAQLSRGNRLPSRQASNSPNIDANPSEKSLNQSRFSTWNRMPRNHPSEILVDIQRGPFPARSRVITPLIRLTPVNHLHSASQRAYLKTKPELWPIRSYKLWMAKEEARLQNRIFHGWSTTPPMYHPQK